MNNKTKTKLKILCIILLTIATAVRIIEAIVGNYSIMLNSLENNGQLHIGMIIIGFMCLFLVAIIAIHFIADRNSSVLQKLAIVGVYALANTIVYNVMYAEMIIFQWSTILQLENTVLIYAFAIICANLKNEE